MLNIKVENFVKLVENDQIEGLRKLDCYCEINVRGRKVVFEEAKKYIKIDIDNNGSRSGRFMIDKATGEIYGIKAYGQINKNHYYGTLDTITNYFWGEYSPIRLKNERQIDFNNLNSVELELQNFNKEPEIIDCTEEIEEMLHEPVKAKINNIIDFMSYKTARA